MTPSNSSINARGTEIPVLSDTGHACALHDLASEVAAACEGSAAAMPERIMAALARAVTHRSLLVPAQERGSAHGYMRHVLFSDPRGRFTILSLVWNGGQHSPPHAHYTWCAYGVLRGDLAETEYEFDKTSGKVRPVSHPVRRPGDAVFSHAGLEQIHQLGNAGTDAAISIHVYGIDGERVGSHVNRLVETDTQETATQ